MILLGVIFSFVYGTAIGSFLNVVIWRMPREESLGGRSHCPHCRAKLRGADLVPIFSYLALGGKCAHCHTRISPRYLIIEMVTGALFVFFWFLLLPHTPLGFLEFGRAVVAVSLLVAIFVIDLEHFLILDRIVFPGWLAIMVLNLSIDLASHARIFSFYSLTAGGVLAGLALGGFFFLFWYVSRGRWMGLGDAKFALLLGAIVGWPLIIVNALLAFFSGALVSVIWLALGTKKLKTAVPFGTFLAVGALLTMIWGSQLWHGYLRLLGWY